MTKRKITNKIQRLISLALVVVMVFAFVGCGTATEDVNVDNSGYNAGAGASADNPYTFIDDYGRTVTVTSYKRTATLIGSFADVWISAGGSVVATANDTWTNFDLGLSSDVVNIGSILNPNVELLIASRPDFVIASCNTDSNIALMQTLENAGITVAYFDVSNFDAYLQMLDICTDITGRKDLYEKNGLEVQKQIEEIKARVDDSHPSVLFLRAAASGVKAKGSEGSVGGELLKDLGCVNIADSDSGLLDNLSLEAIVTADPDYIFVTTQGIDTDAALENVQETLINSPVWSSLTAVKENHYYVLDKRLYNLKPNARWGEAYKELADILYQEN
jgi:iron complex transport system substrate-binding protein